LTCLSVRSGFDSVAPLWTELLGRRDWSSLFLTPEWQRCWWEQFEDANTELCLLTVGPADQPLGVAPLMQRGDTITFLGDTDLFDYHDFIDVAPGFHEALIECLADEEWHSMDLHSVPDFSRTLTALTAASEAKGWSVQVEDEDVVPGLDLPATWDEYVAGLRKKDRHELRRKLRRLESAGEVRVVEANSAALEQEFDLFYELMAESREEKRDFMLPERQEFFRRVINWTSGSDFLRLFFLELNGERVAASLAFDYDGRRLLYNSGFRTAHGALGVGLMLNALCIKDAIERGLTYFDFLRGAEPYKYHLGGQDVGLRRILVTR
jgi:CelD/BcsL family acetyltransferase involved in cellulose biosynthesis